MEVLRSTVHLLHGQTDNSLTRIDRLFLETDPRKGVGKGHQAYEHSHYILYTFGGKLMGTRVQSDTITL